MVLETLERRLAFALHIEDFSHDEYPIPVGPPFDRTRAAYDWWDIKTSTVPGGDTDADPNTDPGPDEFLIPNLPLGARVRFETNRFDNPTHFLLIGNPDAHLIDFAANRSQPGGVGQDGEVAAVGFDYRGAGIAVVRGDNGVKTLLLPNSGTWSHLAVTSNDPDDTGLEEVGAIQSVRFTATGDADFLLLDNIAVLVFDAGFANNAPVGVDDTLVVRSGAPTDIAVLDNDRDLDGDALSIANNLDVVPLQGSAFVQHTAAGPDYVRYTSTAGYVGEDSFTYVLEDGRGGKASATVFISVESLAAPRVESIVINDGSAQRSKINSITVRFDSLVTIDPAAFELRRQGTNLPIGLIVALSEQNGRTLAVLKLSGPGIVGGSLFDGQYTLLVRGDKIRNAASQLLDGDNDGLAGGDRREEFFRRFGDSDGDGDVDRVDRDKFLSSFLRRTSDPNYLWYFDWNDDGRVAVIDLLAFTVASFISQR